MKRILILAILLAVPLATGCRVYHRGYVEYEHPVTYHVHGPGCGHVYYGGVWVEGAHTTIYEDHYIAPRVVVVPPVPILRPWPRFWIGPHYGRKHERDHHR